MNAALSAVVCLLATGSAATAAADAIYRWTDRDGVIHFTSQPPSHVDYRRITPAAPPPGTAPGVDAIQKRVQAIDSTDSKVAKARQEALKAKALDAENCAKARERISFLNEHPAHRLYTVGSDGAESRMTDEQYDAEMAKARDVAANSCN